MQDSSCCPAYGSCLNCGQRGFRLAVVGGVAGVAAELHTRIAAIIGRPIGTRHHDGGARHNASQRLVWRGLIKQSTPLALPPIHASGALNHSWFMGAADRGSLPGVEEVPR